MYMRKKKANKRVMNLTKGSSATAVLILRNSLILKQRMASETNRVSFFFLANEKQKSSKV